MLITLICSIMLMAGLFLILWGGVGFIQDKRFFSSAPREVQAVMPDHVPERFRGQHAVGWTMIILGFILMGGAFVLGAWDGIRNGLNFFPHYYPQTKAVLGRYLFGYNWKTHLTHIISGFPVSALIAWICTLFQ